MGKFTFKKITSFNNCDKCPLRNFVDNDESSTHVECGYNGSWIECYRNDGDEDYRNKDGILDDCPFLKTSTIVDEQNYY